MVAALGDGYLVAWTAEEAGKPVVRSTLLRGNGSVVGQAGFRVADGGLISTAATVGEAMVLGVSTAYPSGVSTVHATRIGAGAGPVLPRGQQRTSPPPPRC